MRDAIKVKRKAEDFLRRGDSNRAVQLLATHLDKNPKNKIIRNFAIEILLANGSFGSALLLICGGLELSPEDVKLRKHFSQQFRSVVFNTNTQERGLAEAEHFMRILGPTLERAIKEQWDTQLSNLIKPASSLVFNAYIDLLTLSSSCEAETALRHPRVRSFMEESLLLTVLEFGTAYTVELERLLVMVRMFGLNWVASYEPLDAGQVSFFQFLSMACSYSEYCWSISNKEIELIEKLLKVLKESPPQRDKVTRSILAVLGCYMPLTDDLNLGEDILKSRHVFWKAHAEWEMKEIALAKSIDESAKIQDPVSEMVSAQYEENPYPRWRGLLQSSSKRYELREYLAMQFPSFPPNLNLPERAQNILIAGCGTGKHAVLNAHNIKASEIIGIDLSSRSLAYACLKAEEHRLENIRFLKCDILNVASLGRSFDFIDSVGVIHHMNHPEAGLNALHSVLKPRGIMRIGLYSDSARTAVSNARRYVEENAFTKKPQGIRQAIANLEASHPAKDIVKAHDFFTASGFRDLVMHEMEHCFRITDLKELVKKSGLRLIGFGSLPPKYMALYSTEYPDDPTRSNWSYLNKFEQKHPGAFTEMYVMWLTPCGK
ncbi:MAG: class I SAM-dependent methyltransferase [Rhodospirillales bacterium]